MTWKQLLGAACLGLTLSSHAAAQQPLLQLQGQPYFGGSMTLHVTAPEDIGQPVLLLMGLDPLPLGSPVFTGKGAFYIGSLTSVVGLGVIGANGRLDIPFTMPAPIAGAEGLPIVLQAFVSSQLANAATLSLDSPYYLPAEATILDTPNPANLGQFGDRFAVGDLNGDGLMDIAVGAGTEDAAGVDQSGRVYVFWGPDLSSVTTLDPPAPKTQGVFGVGMAIGDITGDGIADLVVTEGIGSAAPPNAHGLMYIYAGGDVFVTNPALTVPSVGTGTAYTQFGRALAVADFDGDGTSDIAVGVGRATVQGLSNAGQIEVYWGPNAFSTSVLTAPDLAVSGFYGDRLTAGDVTGDGLADLIVGAPRKKLNGLIAMGRVYLLTGPVLAHWKTIDHPLPDGSNSRFGNAVVARDMNADGVDEMIATDQRNHAFIFWSPEFDTYQLITRPPDPVTGTGVSVSFGYQAGTVDANHDGLQDVIISDYFSGIGGRVYVAIAPYFTDFLLVADVMPEPFTEFGLYVGGADIDGDGREELLIGSLGASKSGILGAGHLTIFDFN